MSEEQLEEKIEDAETGLRNMAVETSLRLGSAGLKAFSIMAGANASNVFYHGQDLPVDDLGLMALNIGLSAVAYGVGQYVEDAGREENYSCLNDGGDSR